MRSIRSRRGLTPQTSSPPRKFFLAAPQPSELLESVLVRTARLNCVLHADEFLAKICYPKIRETETHHNLEMICAGAAALYSKSVSAVIQKHTLVPLMQAFVSTSMYENHGLPLAFSTLLRAGRELISQNPRHCRSCLEEDIAWHGYSFFRRHHQVREITVCRKHCTALIETQGSTWKSLPSDKAFQLKSHRALPDFDLVPLAHRFRAVVEDLLEIDQPISIRDVAAGLRQLASQDGYKFGNVHEFRPDSYGVAFQQREDADAVWARRAIEEATAYVEHRGDAALAVNKAFYAQIKSPMVYIVLALLLTANTEDALRILIPASMQSN